MCVQQLLLVRFRIDFGLDMGIFFLSAWIAWSRIVRLLSNSAAALLLLPTRLGRLRQLEQTFSGDRPAIPPHIYFHRSVSRSLRAVLMLTLMHTLRNLCAKQGLHSRVGNWYDYFTVSGQGLIDAMKSLRSLTGSLIDDESSVRVRSSHGHATSSAAASPLSPRHATAQAPYLSHTQDSNPASDANRSSSFARYLAELPSWGYRLFSPTKTV